MKAKQADRSWEMEVGRWKLGVGVALAISYLLSPISLFGQGTPIATTSFTRTMLRGADSAAVRTTLGFLSTNNTAITNYVGNGASITNLNADELRSGTVPLARLSGITASQIADSTLTTNKVDATFHVLLGGSGNVTQAGLAAGSYLVNSSVPPATNCVFVATNGNNSNNGYTRALAKLTPQAASAIATNGQTIVIGPGVYSIGTNNIVLSDGVNLRGSGIDITVINGYADCAGPEQAFAATGGPQIRPGTNSVISDFTLVCDTNTVNTMAAAAAHSGTWCGIGVSYLNPPSNNSFDNVTIERVRVLEATFDAFHFNSRTNLNNIIIRDCVAVVPGWGFNSIPYLGTTDNRASFTLVNNDFKVHGSFPPDVFPFEPAAYFPGSDTTLINCRGRNTDAAGYAIDTRTAAVVVNVIGGEFWSANSSDVLYNDTEVFGSFRFNGTNYNTGIENITTSTATSGTVTARRTFQQETIYLSSGSTISSITIALPTTTRQGQIFRIHSKSAITTLSVTGGAFTGSAVTSMTAGQTIAYQASNTTGTYVRLQ